MDIEVIHPANKVEISTTLRVSALEEIGGNLWVGFVNGDISIYELELTTSSDSESRSTKTDSGKAKQLKSYRSLHDIKTLFRTGSLSLKLAVKNLAGRSLTIEKMCQINHHEDQKQSPGQVLVAISDSEAVAIYEWNHKTSSLTILNEVEDSKSSVDFLYMPKRQLLLIGSKKRLVVHSVVPTNKGLKIKMQRINDINFKDRFRAIGEFSDSKVLIGLTNDFVILDVDSDFKVESLPTNEDELYNFSRSSSFSYFGLNSSGPLTHIIPVMYGSTIKEYILTQDGMITRFTSSGNLYSVPLKSQVVPVEILFLEPCYLVLVYAKKLEIVDYESGEVIQRFQHQINSNAICASVFEDSIVLSSGIDLFRFTIKSFSDQINLYLNNNEQLPRQKKDGQYDPQLVGLNLAIALIARLSPENSFFESNSINNAKTKQLKLRALYQKKSVLLFEKYSKFHEALVEIGSDWLISNKVILGLFPDFLNGDVLLGGDKSLNQGKYSNQVKEVTLEDLRDVDLFGESGTENEATEGLASRKGNTPPGPVGRPPHIRRFLRAVNNLIIYLTDQRRIYQNFLGTTGKSNQYLTLKWNDITLNVEDVYQSTSPQEVAKVIDTSLFLCYFYTKPMLLGPLLRLPHNHCDSHIVNECLLRNVHNHEERQASFIKELLDFYYGRSLHKEALEMLYKLSHENLEDHGDDFDDYLRGPDLTIQYLQKLNNQYMELICEFSRWVLLENTNPIILGKLLFMNDSYECESYDGFTILNFFSSIIKNDELTITYLEWLIFESDTIERYKKMGGILKLHTRLCLLYIEKLKQLDEETEEDIIFYDDSVYKKLYRFLQTTNQYEPWTVLKFIPTNINRFLRFTVLVYRRLNEHDKSIDVLFNQLDDLDAAMDYCSDIYYQPHNKEVGQRLLHKLLEDLLVNVSGNRELIEKLLYAQGTKMSMLRILTSLPNSFPINHISGYLTNTLRASQEELHDSRISSQLYKVGLIKLNASLLEARMEHVDISSGNQPCSICHKKLGYSVFSVNKSGEISHYGCASRE